MDSDSIRCQEMSEALRTSKKAHLQIRGASTEMRRNSAKERGIWPCLGLLTGGQLGTFGFPKWGHSVDELDEMASSWGDDRC